MIQGKFITLEGIDGAGKSTNLSWLESFLRSMGKNVVVTHEPGGTPLGEKLRALVLDSSLTMHPETEALLMFAARREHLDRLILPALDRGDWVISDRFTDASYAYQGGGRGIFVNKLDDLERWVHGTFQPDLTFYFDVTSELGRKRLHSRTDEIKSIDRFEKEEDEFFDRVRKTYLERAHKFPHRIQIIDSSQPLESVKQSIKNIISSIC